MEMKEKRLKKKAPPQVMMKKVKALDTRQRMKVLRARKGNDEEMALVMAGNRDGRKKPNLKSFRTVKSGEGDLIGEQVDKNRKFRKLGEEKGWKVPPRNGGKTFNEFKRSGFSRGEGEEGGRTSLWKGKARRQGLNEERFDTKRQFKKFGEEEKGWKNTPMDRDGNTGLKMKKSEFTFCGGEGEGARNWRKGNSRENARGLNEDQVDRKRQFRKFGEEKGWKNAPSSRDARCLSRGKFQEKSREGLCEDQVDRKCQFRKFGEEKGWKSAPRPRSIDAITDLKKSEFSVHEDAEGGRTRKASLRKGLAEKNKKKNSKELGEEVDKKRKRGSDEVRGIGKLESSVEIRGKKQSAGVLEGSLKKGFVEKKKKLDMVEGEDSVPEKKKKKKRGIKIDPHDISNKRIDDTPTTIVSPVVPEKEVKLSQNAQFRAIKPSPDILSFVEDNLLGRRRMNELRRAGYNIDLSAPLDNVPFSTSPERERIEDNIFRNKLSFFAAAKVSSSFPPPGLPEIALAGRSNVGKSSLLNALTRQWGVVRTSPKPGLTQTINFFDLKSKLWLVDLPGYGFAYAKEEVKDSWEELVKEYVSARVGLERVCLLIDTKWGMKLRDLELINLMERSQTKYQIILTKTDTVPPIDVARRAMQIQEELKANRSIVEPLMMVSSKSGAGIRSLRTVLINIAKMARR